MSVTEKTTETKALTIENVESVLDEMRPYLMSDGGNVELVDIDGSSGQTAVTGRLWFLS